MRKFFIVVFACIAILSSSNAASDSRFGIYVGALQFSNSSSNSAENKKYVSSKLRNNNTSLSLGITNKFLREVFDDLYIGLGTDLEMFNPRVITSDFGYIFDIYPAVSYRVIDNISVDARIAYSLGGFLGSYTDIIYGFSPGFGVAYNFPRGGRIEFNYKFADFRLMRKNTGSSDTAYLDSSRFSIGLVSRY